MSMNLEARIQRIEELIGEIKTLPSLAPDDNVNRIFSELVDLVVGDVDDIPQFYLSHSNSPQLRELYKDNAANSTIETPQMFTEVVGRYLSQQLEANIPVASFCQKVGDKVRQYASAAESEMEVYWASRIAESDDPFVAMQEFPYTHNYQELVARELQLLEHSGQKLTKNDRVLIIGTGPLPMTALEIARSTGAQVDQVDCSLEALHLCDRVSKKLGVKGDCLLGKGQEVRLDKEYAMVMIAGLAGSTLDDKQEIVDHVRDNLTDDGRVLMRGAYGMRELLYPAFNPTSVDGMDLINQYHPHDHVINSVFIYKPGQRLSFTSVPKIDIPNYAMVQAL